MKENKKEREKNLKKKDPLIVLLSFFVMFFLSLLKAHVFKLNEEKIK